MTPTAKSALLLVGVVGGMFGFGYALVPLYNAVCSIVGVNGKTANTATTKTFDQVDTSRTVSVQFVTTVNGGHDWQFHSEQASVSVNPGAATLVTFHAKNTENHDIVAQAIPNVAPADAGKYLHKTECFCFNQQPFASGETKEMPVRFIVDPDLPGDIDTITLSYTFFDVTAAAKAEAASPNS